MFGNFFDSFKKPVKDTITTGAVLGASLVGGDAEAQTSKTSPSKEKSYIEKYQEQRDYIPITAARYKQLEKILKNSGLDIKNYLYEENNGIASGNENAPFRRFKRGGLPPYYFMDQKVGVDFLIAQDLQKKIIEKDSISVPINQAPEDGFVAPGSSQSTDNVVTQEVADVVRIDDASSVSQIPESIKNQSSGILEQNIIRDPEEKDSVVHGDEEEAINYGIFSQNIISDKHKLPDDFTTTKERKGFAEFMEKDQTQKMIEDFEKNIKVQELFFIHHDAKITVPNTWREKYGNVLPQYLVSQVDDFGNIKKTIALPARNNTLHDYSSVDFINDYVEYGQDIHSVIQHVFSRVFMSDTLNDKSQKVRQLLTEKINKLFDNAPEYKIPEQYKEEILASLTK